MLTAVHDSGGTACLVSLTMRHRDGVPLARYWDALTAGWARVTSGKRWQADQQFFGIRGWVRTVEVTRGDHGWHVHLHCVLALIEPVSEEMLGELAVSMFHRWQRALRRRGFDAIAGSGGLDVRTLQLVGNTPETLGEYLVKAALEVASQATKNGRDGSRTPLQILADGLATGLADDLELWAEYEQASWGRRQMTWSRELRRWAGLGLRAQRRGRRRRRPSRVDTARCCPATPGRRCAQTRTSCSPLPSSAASTLHETGRRAAG